MKSIPIFRGTTGLNTKLYPTRLSFNPETGIQDLSIAVNIDIDDSGMPERRKGHTLTSLTGDCHSLFCDKGECLFVKDDGLFIFHSDYSSTGIRNVTKDVRMDYVQTSEGIYYLNGYERGRVLASISYAWDVGDYVGPETTKTFSNPPTGHLLELYNGRMFIAKDDVVWYSEPFAYGAFNLAKNYIQFSSKIKMLKAVVDGLYVSDSKAIYFHKGGFPAEFQQIKVADYPAIEGTAVKGSGSRVGLEEKIQGNVILLGAEKGLCIATPGGSFINLTERKINIPPAQFGAGLYRDGRYICLLEP